MARVGGGSIAPSRTSSPPASRRRPRGRCRRHRRVDICVDQLKSLPLAPSLPCSLEISFTVSLLVRVAVSLSPRLLALGSFTHCSRTRTHGPTDSDGLLPEQRVRPRGGGGAALLEDRYRERTDGRTD